MALLIKDANLDNQTQKTILDAGEHVPVVSIDANETSTYFAATTLAPTTLTSGLNYFVLRNTNATKKIKFRKIEILWFFTWTAAASLSQYVVRKFINWAATNGGVVWVTSWNILNDTTIAELKSSATGITITGALLDTGNIAAIWHVNQLTANVMYDRDMTDAPLILGQNEGIVVQSNGAVVLWSNILLSLRWIEE